MLILILYIDFPIILVGLALNFSSSVYSVRENETHVSVQLLLNFDEGFNLNQSVEVEFITLEDAAQGKILYYAGV